MSYKDDASYGSSLPNTGHTVTRTCIYMCTSYILIYTYAHVHRYSHIHVYTCRFICPCHGSEYDSVGSVTRGPAPTALALAKVDLLDDDRIQLSTWDLPDFRAWRQCTDWSRHKVRGGTCVFSEATVGRNWTMHPLCVYVQKHVAKLIERRLLWARTPEIVNDSIEFNEIRIPPNKCSMIVVIRLNE